MSTNFTCPLADDEDVVIEDGCEASNVEEIRECFARGEVASLTNDINVDAGDCDGNGVLDVSNTSGLGIVGNGFRIFRTGGQAQCSLIHGTNTQGFDLTDVRLEETPGPDVPALGTYRHMLHFIGGSDICIQSAEVAHSWGYAIYNNGVDGFKFKNSVLRDSGALGLYIGHTANNPTTDVEICGNDFRCNTTNALAVLGGDGVVIDDNMFEDNHKLGVFAVAPQFGTGFTGGGQVYLAEGTNIDFTNNTIKDGFCTNCVTAGILNNPVTGLEIGLPNQNLPVTNLLVDNNTIFNNTAFGIKSNNNAVLDSTTVISGNNVFNNGAGTQISVHSGAVVIP